MALSRRTSVLEHAPTFSAIFKTPLVHALVQARDVAAGKPETIFKPIFGGFSLWVETLVVDGQALVAAGAGDRLLAAARDSPTLFFAATSFGVAGPALLVGAASRTLVL